MKSITLHNFGEEIITILKQKSRRKHRRLIRRIQKSRTVRND